jgi:hypothetical protein
VPPPARPDIYPGVSGSLALPPGAWDALMLAYPRAPSEPERLYGQGRRDAAAWARAAGVAGAGAAARAVAETEV